MKRMTWLLLIAFLSNHMTWAVPKAHAFAPSEQLHFARLQFYAGNYDESLDKLKRAIDSENLSLEELATAWYLKARCEARKDNKRGAVKAFCKMHETEYPIVVSKSDFTAVEAKAYDEATEKCPPKVKPAPKRAPAPESTTKTWKADAAPAAQEPVASQANTPEEQPSDASAPVERAPVVAAPVETAPVVAAPVETAPVAHAGGKRWFQKPFTWIFGAGVAGLVYLLATNDSDRVLADPEDR